MNPTKWDNEYYQNLLNIQWESMKAPGFNRTIMGDPFGTALQWKQKGVPFDARNMKASLMMFTSDLAVIYHIYLYLIKNIKLKSILLFVFIKQYSL